MVSPIADTTTTRSVPRPRSRAIRRATRRIRSASARTDPPNFCTTSGAGIEAFYRARAPGLAGLVASRERVAREVGSGPPSGYAMTYPPGAAVDVLPNSSLPLICSTVG